MIRSIRLTNFRSFKNTEIIELKPIVILVGTNSSGKSSLLRFFPLLKQTVEMPSASPLLWFGRYVDFGSFKEAISRFSSDQHIGVSLGFRSMEVPRFETFSLFGSTTRPNATILIRPEISLSLKHSDTGTVISQCNISIFDDKCEMHLGGHGMVTKLIVNKIDVMKNASNNSYPKCTISAIIPKFDSMNVKMGFIKYITSKIAEEVRELVHKNSSDRTIGNLAGRLYYDEYSKIIEQLQRISSEGKAKKLVPGNEQLARIKALLMAKLLPQLLDRAHNIMLAFSKAAGYIGPFRVDPQRYYRSQELSVSQIEPHGENLAMFLKSLNENERQQFSEWANGNFGFSVHVDRSQDHVEIRVSDGEQKYNVIDMGYGLSQLLPVIAQSWLTISGNFGRTGRVNPSVIAIEQPELHLHPRIQAKLGDMFLGIIDAYKRSLASKTATNHIRHIPSLIIETHSEALINRLGELICSKRLSTADITVLLFEKDSSTGITKVRQSDFDDEGVLKDWPIGFFAP